MPAISAVRLPSVLLESVVSYTALIPEVRRAGMGPYAVLYLLSPYGSDPADWLVKTRLEPYVRDLPLLVILPDLGHSFGCDMASGERYERFFVDELMAHVESLYAVKHGPDHTAVAGAGSGGYAALRLGLSYPYWFGAAASHSGDVLAAQEGRTLELPWGRDALHRYRRVFGDADDSRRKGLDLFRLAEQLPRDQAPALSLDCGLEDPLLAHNREFHRRLTSQRIRHEYAESAGGHTWDYWDSRLPSTLDFTARALGV